MSAPDFIIAGVRRCGTSTLAEGLSRHPRIGFHYGYGVEEVRYFTQHRAEGDDWYRDLWLPGHFIQGEKSPDYLPETWCHKHIARVCPGVKIIAILRHPADRAYSEWNYGRAHGWLDGLYARTPFGKLWKENGCCQAFRHSHYAPGLASLIAIFGRARLHVEIAERFWRDLAGGFDRAFAFLGLPTMSVESPHIESAGPKVEPLAAELRAAITRVYREDIAEVRDLLSDPIPEWDA